MLKKIISGGQTGADKAGLRAAQAVGLATGGHVPRGWRTENGTDLSLRAFGVIEHKSQDYPPRTRENVKNSDGTIIIAKLPLSGGSLLTMKLADQAKKPRVIITTDYLDKAFSLGSAMHWLLAHPEIEILNIAGSRESSVPGLQAQAQEWLEQLFRLKIQFDLSKGGRE